VPLICLLHSTVISLISGYHYHPSVMHLFTHQGISLGQEIAHTHTHTVYKNV